MGIIQSSEPFALPEALTWHSQKVKPGIWGPFMLAGPPVGLYCHHPVKRTVPCLTLLKGCTLACPWCRFRKQFVTYVPLLALGELKRWKWVVTGGKRTWEDAKKFNVGDLVTVARGNSERDTLRLSPFGEAYNPSQLAHWRRRCTDDISPYLFHLWQYRALTEHFGQRYFMSLRVMENESVHQNAAHDEEGKPITD